jgi:hypothetical protein
MAETLTNFSGHAIHQPWRLFLTAKALAKHPFNGRKMVPDFL